MRRFFTSNLWWCPGPLRWLPFFLCGGTLRFRDLRESEGDLISTSRITQRLPQEPRQPLAASRWRFPRSGPVIPVSPALPASTIGAPFCTPRAAKRSRLWSTLAFFFCSAAQQHSLQGALQPLGFLPSSPEVRRRSPGPPGSLALPGSTTCSRAGRSLRPQALSEALTTPPSTRVQTKLLRKSPGPDLELACLRSAVCRQQSHHRPKPLRLP